MTMTNDNTLPTRYIRWDYDTRVAVEYERRGDCNGCGACCTALIRFEVTGDKHPHHGGNGTTEEGAWSEISRGNVRRFFKVTEIDTLYNKPCSHLMEDKRCAIQLTKHLICKGWPFAPEQVAPFEECSYEFVEIKRWDF